MTSGVPVPGALCRPAGGAPGTITAIVRNANGDPCLLSCSHVLASAPLSSERTVVEWFDASANPAQWQPAGTLWKWVEFEGDGGSNSLDAALALLDPPIAREFNGMNALQIAPYDNQYSRAVIYKYNAAAGQWDRGSVQRLFTDQDLVFPSLAAESFKLSGLIECSVENRSGESGSVILVEDGLPFAMHIAGNSVTRSWSVPLQRVFNAWLLEMLQCETLP